MKSTQKTGKPGKGGKNPTQQPEKIETPPRVEEPVPKDPYDDLRYRELTFAPITERQTYKTKKVPVLKKMGKNSPQRCWSGKSAETRATILSQANTQTNTDVPTSSERHDGLRPDILDPPPLSELTCVQDKGVKPSPTVYRSQAVSKVYTQQLYRSSQKESAALKRYTEAKHQQLEMENHCMDNTKKTRKELLLRKKQFLPHLSYSGTEIPVLRQEGNMVVDGLQSQNIFGEDFDSEGRLSSSKLQQTGNGYRTLTQWVACPEITDEIRNELKLNQSKIPLVMKNTEGLCPEGDRMPCTEDLGVVGLRYADAQRLLKEMTRRTKRRTSSSFMKGRSQVSMVEGKREAHGRRERKNVSGGEEVATPSRLSLTIADVKLSWTSNSQKDSQHEKVIELGCTADIGTTAVNSISMKNTGTVAIRFAWVKRQKEGNLRANQFDQMRVIFDSSGGVILPNEVFRLPFMYKAVTRGYFSEDWYLLTTPVLENGAPVILRLWGLSREFDPYKMARQMLAETIRTRKIRNLCRDLVDKIIDYLPLQETSLKDYRFPSNYGSTELFVLKNPWLTYHSVDVYRLGRLLTLIQKERGDQDQTENIKMADLAPGRQGSLEEITGDARRDSLSGDKDNVEEESDDKTSWDFSTYRQELDRIWQETNLDLLKLPDEASETSSHEMKIQSSEHNDELLEGREGESVQESFNEDAEDAVKTGQERVKSEDDHSLDIPKAKRTLTNVVDPDNVVVHALRTDLLALSKNLAFQEAAFHVMSKTVDRLHYRTTLAKGDWKRSVCRNLLAYHMDKFSQYAGFVHQVCCLGETEAQEKVSVLAESDSKSGFSSESEKAEVPQAEPQELPQGEDDGLEAASRSGEGDQWVLSTSQ